ncbi:MAG TPA: hypothetical protein VGG48_03525 [Rhizomicrobium sp.]|jgi:hypothetical protein
MGSGLQSLLAFFRGKTGLSLGAALAAVLLAGGGFWAGRATAPVAPVAHVAAADNGDDVLSGDADTTPAVPPSSQPVSTESTSPKRTYSHRGEAAGASVIAAATKANGTKYVHRDNSVLRKEPSYASETLKKEPKGAQVQMVLISDKWAEVQDGAIKGWMRSSVLKDDPPGTKHPRKKKDDTGGDDSGD